jgi:hypothetical protein
LNILGEKTNYVQKSGGVGEMHLFIGNAHVGAIRGTIRIKCLSDDALNIPMSIFGSVEQHPHKLVELHTRGWMGFPRHHHILEYVPDDLPGHFINVNQCFRNSGIVSVVFHVSFVGFRAVLDTAMQMIDLLCDKYLNQITSFY